MPEPRLLEVGRIVKPHGLRGEVIVDLISDRVDRLEPGSVLTTDRGPLEVRASRPHQGRWIVVLDGVGDRSHAEDLRGTVLRAESVEEPDTWWVHDLIGSEVVDLAGTTHGHVVAVEANPASDLLVLDRGALVPLRFVVSTEGGRVTVDAPDGLFEITGTE